MSVLKTITQRLFGRTVIDSLDLNQNAWYIDEEQVTTTAAELNTLDGITASTAELNVLDGITASTAELNIMDGVTVTAAQINTLANPVSLTGVARTITGTVSLADADGVVDFGLAGFNGRLIGWTAMVTVATSATVAIIVDKVNDGGEVIIGDSMDLVHTSTVWPNHVGAIVGGVANATHNTFLATDRILVKFGPFGGANLGTLVVTLHAVVI